MYIIGNSQIWLLECSLDNKGEGTAMKKNNLDQVEADRNKTFAHLTTSILVHSNQSSWESDDWKWCEQYSFLDQSNNNHKLEWWKTNRRHPMKQSSIPQSQSITPVTNPPTQNAVQATWRSAELMKPNLAVRRYAKLQVSSKIAQMSVHSSPGLHWTLVPAQKMSSKTQFTVIRREGSDASSHYLWGKHLVPCFLMHFRVPWAEPVSTEIDTRSI